MSMLAPFMRLSNEILDRLDRDRLKPNPNQPPVFVRTNWLFVEMGDARQKAERLLDAIRISRLETNVEEAARLTAELVVVSRQLAQLAVWAGEQFRKELPDGN